MATINVKDAAGATVALEKPLVPGQAAASASRPVVLASDDTLVVTVGNKTDAKSASTDGSSVSGISIWKQISASIQAAAASLAGTLTVGTHAVTGSGNFATTVADSANVTEGGVADAAVTAGASGSISAKLRSISRDLVANIVLAAGANIIGKVGIDQTTNGTTNKVAADLRVAGVAVDTGVGTSGAATPRVAIDSSQVITSGTAGTPSSQVMTVQGVSSMTPIKIDNTIGQSPKGFSAAFTTLTRPANTTAYTAGDSISNNATAGSVTALTATVSDTNDDPITLTELLIDSTDTGLAGKRIRAYLYNSDPTASSGVVGGDNAAFSNKKAGYIGSMSGVLESGFSDGVVGRLTPSYNDGAAASTPNAAAGGFIVTKPTSGAKTLFVQFQAIDGFAPSANSTTIIATARGFQGRAS